MNKNQEQFHTFIEQKIIHGTNRKRIPSGQQDPSHDQHQLRYPQNSSVPYLNNQENKIVEFLE